MKGMPGFWSKMAAMLLLGVAGCKTPPPAPESLVPPVTVMQTKLPVTLDGKLTDVAWSQTPGYTLTRVDDLSSLPPSEAARARKDPTEHGVVKFLYDDKNLYIGVLFADSDVLHYGMNNQTDLKRDGDTVTVLLKPADAPGVIALSVSATNLKSSFYYPGCGMLEMARLSSPDAHEVYKFQTRTHISGTINRHDDFDADWSAELSVPRQTLAELGVAFAPGHNWTVLAVRHNYGRNFATVQHYTMPAMPTVNFSWCSYYAPIVFQ